MNNQTYHPAPSSESFKIAYPIPSKYLESKINIFHTIF